MDKYLKNGKFSKKKYQPKSNPFNLPLKTEQTYRKKENNTVTFAKKDQKEKQKKLKEKKQKNTINETIRKTNQPPMIKVEKKQKIEKDIIDLESLNTRSEKELNVYKKKTHREHVLLRPDTYIGSTEMISEKRFIFNDQTERIELKKIHFVPGLYKIFDEILVNAADHKQRDPKMTTIKVQIDLEQNEISVWNDGKGIPVEIQKIEKLYVPELIFGHLLTGSNFDDNTKKTIGGRNGFGAKLCNIFSKEFIIETNDKQNGKKFYQKYCNNMLDRESPKITKAQKKDFTHIIFKPDLEKFGMKALDNDIYALFKKRVYDIAGTTAGVKVYFNKKKIGVKNFQQYCKLYIKPTNVSTIHPKKPIFFNSKNERWQICVLPSDGKFQQISFVNSICTSDGGTHVNYIVNQIIKSIISKIPKRQTKGITIKGYQIKRYLQIFINSLVDNPTFDSQTKFTLTTRFSKFGSKCELSDNFLNGIKKSNIINDVISLARMKEDNKLKRRSGKRKQRLNGFEKLDDANFAGSKESKKCTLIVTEGDSAKSLAVSGLSVIGRDYYGVYPIKGKLLNTRDATNQQIMKNKEIDALIKILGLKYGTVYTKKNIYTLRYGHLMIMVDQDLDGSHIKGLIINFIHHFWPSLLKVKEFLQEFVTPIVKVTKKSKKEQKITFFTLPEFNRWKMKNNNGKGWYFKYYKGLGTSTTKEAKEYFGNLKRHIITFKYKNELDDQNIELAFSKDKITERKKWLKEVNTDLFVDHSKKELIYKDFINRELILFSNYDNVRSIPSMVDGLKPAQRKILYCCLKKKLNKEIKVAQLVGYVSEHSVYHHGEESLANTIVGMAQDFVGSNNINLLLPIGQFGTRLKGGKDAASSRYIFTKLSPLTQAIFPKEDEQLLDYLIEDDQQIEPKYYVPIIPMILVNGCDGIGTGYATKIPNYSPREIVKNIKRKLKNKKMIPMKPYYRNFKGVITEIKNNTVNHNEIIQSNSLNNNSLSIKKNVNIKKQLKKKNGKKYNIYGIWGKDDENTIRVTELPLNTKYCWTQNYKEFLESITIGNKDNIDNQIIDNFKEFHTDQEINFLINFSDENMSKIEKMDIEHLLKLTSSISTTNMYAFDTNHKLKRYNSPEQIIDDFFELRWDMYRKRKKFLLEKVNYQLKKLKNIAKFIKLVISKEINFNIQNKKELIKDLENKNFQKFTKKFIYNKDNDMDEDEYEYKKKSNNKSKSKEGGKGKNKTSKKVIPSYGYLLSLSLWSLTNEKYQKTLEEKRVLKEKKYQIVTTLVQEMWKKDLDNFIEIFDIEEQKYLKNQNKEILSKNYQMEKRKRKSFSSSKKKNNQNLKRSKTNPIQSSNNIMQKFTKNKNSKFRSSVNFSKKKNNQKKNINHFSFKNSNKFNNNIGGVYNLDDKDDGDDDIIYIEDKDNNVNMNQKNETLDSKTESDSILNSQSLDEMGINSNFWDDYDEDFI
ncbi:DNA topoisomerase/gyrase [Anaeramoeba flamelloides]|uniref:DNA topoisomerase 2 n=1 Tax=Anaeramoeba flamelloides TaxID=1746091 RepID=A0AAV7YIB9_9EUKA|nr:DNA topoisomerase/gyrase [Anaeramoeba flamelloides]